ncbi:hypothetical protein PVAP13_8NG264801 [Panicum virgatum]|uniref:Uncharacterized protein n=1 Tax=Panicum virgatum TaxID=38727 RepID=A0A8T0PAN7_PANVG|nr:hypothetical protein PVAP13_8NG264801 [Panicum virgatum]
MYSTLDYFGKKNSVEKIQESTAWSRGQPWKYF